MFNLIAELIGDQKGTVQIEMVPINCCKCALPFAVPARFEQARRADHETFYCPNGHPQGYYGKSALEKAREKLKEQEERAAGEVAKRLQTEKLLEQERKKNAGQKKKLDRVAKGVCPCCNRSFVNLKRHMDSKHPEHK